MADRRAIWGSRAKRLITSRAAVPFSSRIVTFWRSRVEMIRFARHVGQIQQVVVFVLCRQGWRLLLVFEKRPGRFAIGSLGFDRDDFEFRITKSRQRSAEDAAGVNIDRVLLSQSGTGTGV